MIAEDIYSRFKSAYTEENLTKITSGLINLYKNRQYDSILAIAGSIKHIIPIEENRVNKIFSKLIMLYHPDKLNFYLQEIEKLQKAGNSEELFRFSHILIILNKEEDVFAAPLLDLDDLLPDGQRWGYDEEDLVYFTDLETSELFDGEEPEYEAHHMENQRDFFSALKRKEYGNLDIDLFYYHLEEMDGALNLADYEIEDLNGVEFCRNITALDLSDNNITDLSKLHSLKQLTELYLANNFIDDVAVLFKLGKLKIVDLSCNQIEDIRQLYHLDNLEYLNISGNDVPEDQIRELTENGVVVIN